MAVQWLDPDQQEVWRIFLDVHSRLLARLDAELQACHAMSLADYEVLVHLSEAPGRQLRMAELADRLLISPSGLTRRLDGLVRDGLVERHACPSDRRGSLAVLTARGLTALEQAAPTHVTGVRRYLIDRLECDQLLDLAAAFASIREGLDDAQQDAPLTRRSTR